MRYLITSIALVTLSLQIALAQNPTTPIRNPRLNPINMGLDSIEYWNQKMKIGDQRRGAKLIHDLDKLQVRFARGPSTQDADYKYISQRIKTLRQAIKTKSQTTVAKPTPTANKKSNTPSTQTEAAIASSKNRTAPLNSIAKTMSATEMTTDQAAKIVSNLWKKYRTVNELPEIRKVMRSGALSQDDVNYLVKGIKGFEIESVKDLAIIKQSPETQRVGSDLARWLETGGKQKIEQIKTQLKMTLDSKVRQGVNDAQSVSQLDPEKNRYTFATESVRKNWERRLGHTVETLKNAKRLEESLDLSTTWSDKLSEVESYVATFRSKVAAASKVSTLPQDIGDRALAKIAKSTLANKKYGVGKIEQLIVNSKKMPRNRIEHKAFNGRLETIVRKWEEFQVCTVELENGKRFVYFNTLKNFSHGPATTPIDQWILSKRFKQGEFEASSLK
jgi:hypothetical protein